MSDEVDKLVKAIEGVQNRLRAIDATLVAIVMLYVGLMVVGGFISCSMVNIAARMP